MDLRGLSLGGLISLLLLILEQFVVQDNSSGVKQIAINFRIKEKPSSLVGLDSKSV